MALDVKNAKDELFFILIKHINRILEHTAVEYRGGFTQDIVTQQGIIQTYIPATNESLSNAIDGLLAATTFILSEPIKQKLKTIQSDEDEKLKTFKEDGKEKKDWFNIRVEFKLKQFQLLMEDLHRHIYKNEDIKVNAFDDIEEGIIT